MLYRTFILIFISFILFTVGNSLLIGQNSAVQKTQSETKIENATALKDQAKSNKLQIYILTIEPGEGVALFWSWWGHTAILVRDPVRRLDIVFDYGRFAEQSLGFLLKQAQGKPVFFLGVGRLQTMIAQHKLQNRGIVSQEILLGQEKLEKFYEKLIINAQPKNRNYIYRHLSNNCTTKVRDLINELFDGALREKFTRRESTKTIRYKGVAPVTNIPPLYMFINSLSGHISGRYGNVWDVMYLPTDLLQALEIHRTDIVESNSKPQIGPIEVLFTRQGPPAKQNLIYYWFLFILFLLSYVIIFHIWPFFSPKQGISKYTSRLGWWFWYIGAGFVGTLLFYIYVFEGSKSYNYQEVGYNFTLHAVHPLFLLFPVAWLLLRKSNKSSKKKIWYWLHRAPLLFAEIGLGLAIFFAHHAIPVLLFSILIQRLLLWQLKEKGFEP